MAIKLRTITMLQAITAGNSLQPASIGAQHRPPLNVDADERSADGFNLTSGSDESAESSDFPCHQHQEIVRFDSCVKRDSRMDQASFPVF